MKCFVAIAFLVCSTYGQRPDEFEIVDATNPWTGEQGIRLTKACEPSSGTPRGKRQAQDVEPQPPNCFYHANLEGQELITPPDCEKYCGVDANRACKAKNGTTVEYTCTSKPVFTALGKYDICDKFPDNFQGRPGPGPWFNTVGSNYGCSSATCCLWFPPTKCADIPLVRYRFLPFVDEKGSDNRAATGLQINDCNDQQAVEDNAITAAEINQGQDGQQKQVCIYQASEFDDEGNPLAFEFQQLTVQFADCEPSYSPAAGCCRFAPIRTD